MNCLTALDDNLGKSIKTVYRNSLRGFWFQCTVVDIVAKKYEKENDPTTQPLKG
jgi:hypothetical protein